MTSFFLPRLLLLLLPLRPLLFLKYLSFWYHALGRHSNSHTNSTAEHQMTDRSPHHSPPANLKVKNEGNCTYAVPLYVLSWHGQRQLYHFYLYLACIHGHINLCQYQACDASAREALGLEVCQSKF